jgi:hypothetical protein
LLSSKLLIENSSQVLLLTRVTSGAKRASQRRDFVAPPINYGRETHLRVANSWCQWYGYKKKRVKDNLNGTKLSRQLLHINCSAAPFVWGRKIQKKERSGGSENVMMPAVNYF